MTTAILLLLAVAAGGIAGLTWRWYDGEAEVRSDNVSPLRCAQLNATVIWCGIKGLVRAVVHQLVLWYVKIRNRV